MKSKKFFLKINSKILKSKKIQINKEEASEFYKVHQTKPFYDRLCNYLSSGPIVVMILEGVNIIEKYRKLMGATDPKNAKEGTLRKSLLFLLIRILCMVQTLQRMQKRKSIFF